MTTYQNDIHTCHADCQNPICIEARKAVKAFPISSSHYEHGMDLRDYFAAQAMTGAQIWDAVLNGKNSGFVGDGPRQLAKVAYAIADEMMKARGQ